MIRDILYNVLILVADGLLLAHFARNERLAAWVMPAGAVAIAMLVSSVVLGINIFHSMRLLSFGVFLHAPLLLAGASILARRRSTLLSVALGAGVLGIVGVGVDAFLIEPTALEVNHVRVESAKITQPIRIVVVADLQTDQIGEHERHALSQAMSLQPDLVLMPGDYIHAYPKDRRDRIADELRSLMLEVNFDAPLGVFAVRGNVEYDDWTSIFDGLPVTPMPRSETLATGEVSLTGLAFRDSFNRHIEVPSAPGFHIVFGHAPDFALGDVDADLLIAGHTHGGQVRLPLIGPLITFSRVPRSWAAGVTQLESGATLVVSRGIGMERGYAPRLRFLCKPELVVIELVPKPGPPVVASMR